MARDEGYTYRSRIHTDLGWTLVAVCRDDSDSDSDRADAAKTDAGTRS